MGKFIGQQLQNLREQKQLSIYDVHKECGIDRSTLTRYEVGKLYPSERDLAKLAATYNVRFKHLLFHSILDKTSHSLVAGGFEYSNLEDYVPFFRSLIEHHLKSKK